jgi:predicted hydrocarbon binding protein
MVVSSSILPTIDEGLATSDDFFQSDYLKHDLRRGTLFNRSGTKMCMMPAELLFGLRKALEDETGDAWRAILKRCGRIWGNRVARRFQREVGDYYGRPLYDLPMSEFTQLIEAYFRSHGWGNLRLDFTLAPSGIITARMTNSAMVEVLGTSPQPVDSIISGLLGALIAQVSDRTDIECYETECTAMGATYCRFILGIQGRIAKVPAWVEEGLGHDACIERLGIGSEKAGAS